MTDVLKTIAADLLEAPEEAAKLMGQGLAAAGAALEKLAERLDALEAEVRGQ